MGLIIAKFRKKKSNADVLDRLDKEIKFIEEFGRDTEQKQRKIVGRFLLLSIGVYVVATFLFCYCFYPADLKSRALSTIPIILTPVVILCLKWLLSWYFSRKLDKNQKKLVRLKDEKKKLLENIMETETYKVARGILEKYAPEQVRKVGISNELTPARPVSSPGTEVRNRFPAKPRASIGASQTPQPSNFLLPKPPAPSSFNNQIVPRVGAGPITPRTPLPRSILPRDRSVLDKMVEYLVGDGPSNRYALICRQCSGHNGMALKEEFEYISYQCCYCYTFNPARKKRPAAPKLEFEGVPALSAPSDTSESEKNSGSDSDQDVRSENKRASPEPAARTSDTEAVSDFDKLSDIETKTSDTETAENERVEPEEETKVETTVQ